ncbi:hypothetical protein [Pandoraea anhela]|nr:hypothetical protein [Pandoraea anhela]
MIGFIDPDSLNRLICGGDATVGVSREAGASTVGDGLSSFTYQSPRID